MLHRLGRQIGKRCIRSFFEDRKRSGIANKLVCIDQPAKQLVVAIRGEAIFYVEAGGNGLRVKAIETQHFVAQLRRFRDGIGTRKGGDPLPEGSTWSKAVVAF